MKVLNLFLILSARKVHLQALPSQALSHSVLSVVYLVLLLFMPSIRPLWLNGEVVSALTFHDERRDLILVRGTPGRPGLEMGT